MIYTPEEKEAIFIVLDMGLSISNDKEDKLHSVYGDYLLTKHTGQEKMYRSDLDKALLKFLNP